jgi:aminoglycoside 3-N-acetyltransferase
MRVPRDGVLVVHSAIAALSRRGFRAESMIEALMGYMDAGTVVMPTMTWRTVTPERPDWDELSTPSHTGVLTEIFRTRYATARSIHPTHSAAAHGPLAQRLLSRHHIDDTPVSANSPYGLMREEPAYVLMLGVGLETCTAIHLPEELIAPDVYVRPAEQAELYRCRDRYGVLHQVRTRRHWRLDRDFPQFASALRAQAGDVDGCGYMIVALQNLLEVVTDALHADTKGTLKLSRRNPTAPETP